MPGWEGGRGATAANKKEPKEADEGSAHGNRSRVNVGHDGHEFMLMPRGARARGRGDRVPPRSREGIQA